MTTLPGRNAICPCGSGKKFKHCCARKTAVPTTKSDRKRKPVIGAMVNGLGILAGAFLVVLIVNMLGSYDSKQEPRRPTGKTRSTIAPTHVSATDLAKIINFGTVLSSRPNDVAAVLDKFNRAPCDCGCPYTLAKCVLADEHCPQYASLVAGIQKEIDELAPATKEGKRTDSDTP